jgi:Flp pilus assembly protein TadG
MQLLRIKIKKKNYNLKNCIDGSVAIIFTIAIIPVLLTIAMAIDYTNASDSNAKLQSAADASSLAALSYIRSVSTPDNSTLSKAQNIAENTFKMQTKNINTVTTTNPEFKIKQTGNSFQSDVYYNASLKTMMGSAFQSIMGSDFVLDKMTVKGGASAILDITENGAGGTTNKYVNIYFMLDVSSSMSVGASDPDILALEKEFSDIKSSFKGACAYACHDGAGYTGTDGKNYADMQDWAIKKNVKLRWQMVNEGVTRVIEFFKTIDPAHKYVHYSIDSFDEILTKVANLQCLCDADNVMKNLPSPKIAPNKPEPFNLGSYTTAQLLTKDFIKNGATEFDNNIQTMVDSVGLGGDGSSPSNPKKIFILASDGVQDPNRMWDATSSGYDVVKGFDMSFCKKMQANNVTIAILHTPVVPIYPGSTPYIFESTFNPYKHFTTLPNPSTEPVQPDTITPAFKACAGDNYVLASDATAIESGVKKMFSTQVSKLRLIN